MMNKYYIAGMVLGVIVLLVVVFMIGQAMVKPSIPSGPAYAYGGCFAENQTGARTLENYLGPNFVSGDECYSLAKAQGYKYFGLQYADGSPDGRLAQCWAGNVAPSMPSSACIAQDAGGNLLGNSWTNALYTINH